MEKQLRNLEDLPRQTSTAVKNQWGDVVRQVREQGGVAVTNHASVDMVLLDAGAYQRMVSEASVIRQRQQSVLEELDRRFDARLAVLQQADAARKLDKVLASRGKLGKRPKVGESF